MRNALVLVALVFCLVGCEDQQTEKKADQQPLKGDGTFGSDLQFLKKHIDVVLLKDKSGQAQVAVAPGMQGRVMTSTAGGAEGLSFGWINREADRLEETEAAHQRVRRRGTLLDGARRRPVLDLLCQGRGLRLGPLVRRRRRSTRSRSRS